jgi:hypothetical protein
METATRARGWSPIPLGPWERYRRDLRGGRYLIVAPGLDGHWTWDMWSPGSECLAMPINSFATATDAKEDVDRAAAESAIMTDEQMIERNAIDAFAGSVAFRLVVIDDEDKRCAMCHNEITPGVAAEEIGEAAWLWCGSCASRNPGSVLADETIPAT